MRAPPLHLSAVLAASFVLLLGCDESGDGTGDTSGAGGASGPGATTGAGGAGATVSTGTGATGTGATTTGATTTGATTGTGGTTTGAGGGASGESVACDSLTCALPGYFCCQNYNEPAECLAVGATCVYGVPLSCDGPEDCDSGEVCCGDVFKLGQNESFTNVACAATCTGMDHRVVCGASGACPTNESCTTSDILPPYLDCQ